MKLHIENIRHQFGSLRFHYDTCIMSGITGIFGLSGAGKTTLMNIISGIEIPVSGRLIFNNITFFDKTANINLPENKRNVGVVFQDNYLFPHLSVRQNLLYSKPYLKKKKQVLTEDTVTGLLDIKELLDKKPFQLSGGERQRVAIGRTLLSQLGILLLDEPFSNLDKNRRKKIISYLLKINARFGIPLLIISHDLEDILKLTHSLLIIKDRKVQVSGNYLDIADAGHAPDVISHKRFINTIELYHTRFIEKEYLNTFGLKKDADRPLLITNSSVFKNSNYRGRKVRLCIYPDDIALTLEPVKHTTIQNLIKGKIRKIRTEENTCFFFFFCGIDLVAEVTGSAVHKLNLKPGDTIYCLIKAKAIEIVHIYEQ